MRRIFLPFLVWSALIFILHHTLAQGSSTTLPFTLGGFYEGLMNNSIEPIYWFFYSMFAITLAMPILSLIKDNKRALWYMVFATFLFTSVLPFASKLLDLPWNSDLTIPVAGSYIMYVVLGWLFAGPDFHLQKKWLYLLYAAGIACLVLRYAQTYAASAELGATDGVFFNYLAFTAVIPSAALFLLVKENENKLEFLRERADLIKTISGASFGVYLIHKPILDNVVIGFFGIPWNSILLRTVFPLIFWALCVCIVLLLKKIPFVKEIVP